MAEATDMADIQPISVDIGARIITWSNGAITPIDHMTDVNRADTSIVADAILAHAMSPDGRIHKLRLPFG
jgi:hypothetical protein